MVRIAIGAIFVMSALCASVSTLGQNAVPAPIGRLVDLGGRRLHQYCTGTGSPAVIIENGAAAFSIDCVHVQNGVSRFTEVCTYDRAGYAWSDRGPGQDTIEETIDDLHLLLVKSLVRPPYVLVGASLGAIYARAYQRRFPEHVGGIVFVDGTHDEAITFMSGGKRSPISLLSADELRVAFAEYEKGAPKPGAGKPDQEPLDRLPPDLRAARFWAFSKLVDEVGLLPKGLAAAESWRQESSALHRQRHRAHPLGSLPLVAMERGVDVDETWHAQQRDLAALSTAGRVVTVEGSGHMIHLYKPEQVVQTIRELVMSRRASQGKAAPKKPVG